MPLHKRAIGVKRLVGLAYAKLPEQYRNRMAVETSCSTLDNAYLQRHLLAVETPTVEAAVQARNEFLQV